MKLEEKEFTALLFITIKALRDEEEALDELVGQIEDGHHIQSITKKRLAKVQHAKEGMETLLSWINNKGG